MSDKKEIHTFVFSGEIDTGPNPFSSPYLGMEAVAWAAGDAIERKDQLEEFIRELANGDIEDPETAAAELMNKMGWS